jgi:glucose dehydrogenase
MAAKDYASTRYSALDQITPSNVKNLKVAFTFSMGVDRGQEAAPLVIGDTMYLVAPYPNYLYALDLSKPGAPMKWKFEPQPNASAQGVACCDVLGRPHLHEHA